MTSSWGHVSEEPAIGASHRRRGSDSGGNEQKVTEETKRRQRGGRLTREKSRQIVSYLRYLRFLLLKNPFSRDRFAVPVSAAGQALKSGVPHRRLSKPYDATDCFGHGCAQR